MNTLSQQHLTTSSQRVRVECPICGPADRSVMLVSNDLPIVRCQECSLMFVGEAEPESVTEEFFRSEHITDQELTRTHYVDWRRESLVREAQIIRDLQPEGGRLLDVGAASGLFIQQFQDHAEWQVDGVEPSRVSAQFANQHFGLNIHVGYLEDQKFEDDSFDVITSLDSFVCHRNPMRDLLEMNRILRPRGLLAIELGGLNFRLWTSTGLLCRLLHGVPARLNAGVNYFYYDRSTLTRLAEKCGFQFSTSFPEAMPSTGNKAVRLAKSAYFRATSLLYRISGGRVSFVPKEFMIFRKSSEMKARGILQFPQASESLRSRAA